MTVIVNDTFTGANGTMPANWSIILGGGTAAINNNRFRLAGDAIASLGQVLVLRSSPSTNDDLDMVLTFEAMTSTAEQQYLYLYLHHTGVTPTTAYNLVLQPGSTSPDAILRKAVNNTYTTLASTPTNTIDFSGIRKVRFQAFRSTGTIRYKVWLASAAEPAAWTGTATDPSPLAAGKIAIGTFNGNNSTIRPFEIDNLTVDDNAVVVSQPVAPPAAPRVVDHWTGTALVRQRTDRWDGSALALRAVEPFLLWDSFNRTSAVSAGSTPTGQVWIPATGSTWGTDGDRLYNVTSTDGAFISADVGKPDQDLTVTLAQGALTANAFPEIVMSNDDAQTPFGYWIECQGSGSLRVVQTLSSFDQVVSGVFTSTAAQTIRVKVEQVISPAPANRITVWVNGVQKFTADHTDPARATGTRIGFRHGQLNTATVQKWDNLSVR